MAKNVNIKLGANITDFESKMKRAQRGFKKTARNLKKIGKSMSLSLTAPLTAFAAASVKAFDTQAKAEAQLRTALGENETAFKNLTEQAKELQEITWALGAEYWFRDVFAFRAGYFNENEEKGARQFFSLGAGFKYTSITVDLSYLMATSNVNNPLEGTLRFGLTFAFGEEMRDF